jgi:hypothetical protein
MANTTLKSADYATMTMVFKQYSGEIHVKLEKGNDNVIRPIQHAEWKKRYVSGKKVTIESAENGLVFKLGASSVKIGHIDEVREILEEFTMEAYLKWEDWDEYLYEKEDIEAMIKEHMLEWQVRAAKKSA